MTMTPKDLDALVGEAKELVEHAKRFEIPVAGKYASDLTLRLLAAIAELRGGEGNGSDVASAGGLAVWPQEPHPAEGLPAYLEEADRLALLATLFEQMARLGENTLTFAPGTLVDYAAAIRFVLAQIGWSE